MNLRDRYYTDTIGHFLSTAAKTAPSWARTDDRTKDSYRIADATFGGEFKTPSKDVPHTESVTYYPSIRFGKYLVVFSSDGIKAFFNKNSKDELIDAMSEEYDKVTKKACQLLSGRVNECPIMIVTFTLKLEGDQTIIKNPSYRIECLHVGR